MLRVVGLVFGAGLLAAACAGGGEAATTTRSGAAVTTTTTVPASSSTIVDARSSLSVTASAYLDEALGVMREYSINRDSVDWEQVEESAFRVAFGAEEPADTHAAIQLALSHLNDQHSVFLSPSQAEAFRHGDAVYTTPVVAIRSENIGYVAIGRYLGDVGEQSDEYAADVAGQIDEMAGGVCGWIVDLRSNSGGNMWPMIAALGPLLDQGRVGSFTYPDGTIEPWDITGSVATWDGMVMADNSLPSPSNQGLPVAVLIGRNTGSSGEAVAIAFHGQDDARFFGQSTAGLTTSNEPVELSDGAIIALTMSNFTDRFNRQYGQDTPVEPDQPTRSFTEAETAAVDWLDSQPTCTAQPNDR